jgi:hypothetical protein
MATNNSINANSTTPLPIVDGGTQVTSVTITPTATAFAGWDANKNLSANNPIPGYATTVSSATPIVLTVASAYQQYITGSTAQTVTMPVTSTLAAVASGTAQSYLIVNDSSNTTTVNSSGGNLIESLPAGSQGIFTCILNSGTTAASWASDFVLNVAGVSSITGTANQIIASASTGAVTLSLPQSIATSSAVQFASVQFSGNNGLIDSNGKEMLTLNPAGASAVNNIQIGNSAATNPVGLTAIGTDTNISFQINGKGNLGGAISGSTAGTNAVAGYVGEVITSAVTTVAISNNTFTNVTSISLTAGDWDVWGNILTNPAGTTTQIAITGGISTTTATLPANQYLALGAYSAGNAGGGPVPYTRINVSSTTTVYLVAVVVYSVSTLTINGTLTARRAR